MGDKLVKAECHFAAMGAAEPGIVDNRGTRMLQSAINDYLCVMTMDGARRII